MPLCMCGHEDREHAPLEKWCSRCSCETYSERPDYARTTSFTDLPVSQGARDLWDEMITSRRLYPGCEWYDVITDTLDILAEADPKDVRSLLWARRTGKL